jgi:hypothetical protein
MAGSLSLTSVVRPRWMFSAYLEVGNAACLLFAPLQCFAASGVQYNRNVLDGKGIAMQVDKVWDDYTALPQEAQRLVADYVAFLRQRYQNIETGRNAETIELSQEPFVGMWQDRPDMQDSTAWVQSVREREWIR